MECEAAKKEEIEITTTTTTKQFGKRKSLPKTLPRETIELDLDGDEKQYSCRQCEKRTMGADWLAKCCVTKC